jgi:hypothetical protein
MSFITMLKPKKCKTAYKPSQISGDGWHRNKQPGTIARPPRPKQGRSMGRRRPPYAANGPHQAVTGSGASLAFLAYKIAGLI